MKKVLVTGATGDIGEAIVREFAHNGYFVYIHYGKNEHKAKQLQQEISYGQIITFDMGDKTAIKEALRDIDVDVLVNNAAIIRDNLFFFMSDQEWEDVISVDLNGMFHVTKAIAGKMIANKSGSIVNVTSVSAVTGNAGQTNYSAAKGGVVAFGKALSAEVARYGIRVNAVAPGIIESEMTKELDMKKLKSHIPAGRMGTPQEVSEVVYFLGNGATYINGAVINVNGGMVR
ncbi:MAG: SDR family NAD(P)-dependent oxidoreductase [Campylobacterota bacterium]